MKRRTSSRVAPVPEILDTRALAKYLGCSTQFLEIARIKGSAIPFVKIGSLVRYRKSAVDAWLASNEVRSTSEERPACHES